MCELCSEAEQLNQIVSWEFMQVTAVRGSDQFWSGDAKDGKSEANSYHTEAALQFHWNSRNVICFCLDRRHSEPKRFRSISCVVVASGLM